MTNTTEQRRSVLDCRISTTKQASGISLEQQEQIGKNYAQSRGWSIEKTFSKVYSGRAEERQDFEDTLSQFISTSLKALTDLLVMELLPTRK